MNKTVTINISGIIFHIEEDAYEKLSKYLSTIKGYFSNADGGNEIMGDIEARIAEMLQSRTSPVKQVVLMADVDFVMDSMGRPEDFAGDQGYEEKTTEKQEQAVYEEPVKRRLFRDPDSKVLGGVCGGIGNYFDFDATWLRIVLALVTFFSFGSLIIVYIILWIAIPEARTTADKLAMKGEKADINNIRKAVQEEAEQVKKRMEKYGDDLKNFTRDNRHIPRTGADKFLGFLADIFRAVGRVVLVVIGVGLLVFGVIFLFALISSILGFSVGSINGMDARHWADMYLIDGSDVYLGMLGIALAVGIPVVAMIYAGIRLLFRIRFGNRWVSLSAGVLWTVGVILCFYIFSRTASDYSQNGKIRENVKVVTKDTLYLALNPAHFNPNEFEVDGDDEGTDHFRWHHNNYLRFGHKQADNYIFGHPELSIIRSQTSQVEMVLVKTAKGGTKKAALDRAGMIAYEVSQKDSLLVFNDYFMVKGVDKARDQDMKIVLKIPEGKVIYLDPSVKDLIYDIENVDNALDDEMVGRRWIMTRNGLKCMDCSGLDIDGLDNDDVKDVKIGEQGINLEGKHTHVNIDSNGVNINGKHAHIKIDEHGIHVDKNK